MEVENTTVDQATEQTNLDSTSQPEETFTQEDLVRIGTKEHKSGYSKAIRDLGFEDVESAQNALKAYQEWQASQKTEAEKQSEALIQKEKELAEAVASNKALEAKLVALSAGVNPESVEDVITLAQKGVNDETTIDKAIQAVLEKYPQFGKVEQVEATPRPNIIVGGNPEVNSKGNDPFQAVMDSYKNK